MATKKKEAIQERALRTLTAEHEAYGPVTMCLQEDGAAVFYAKVGSREVSYALSEEGILYDDRGQEVALTEADADAT